MSTEHVLASMHAHRIAVDTVLAELVEEVFGGSAEKIDRFKAIADRVNAEVDGTTYERFGTVPAEWIKQQILHSLDGLLGETHKRMVQQLREHGPR